MFSVAELATMVENHLPIAIVVINNHGYGEIKRQMLAEGIDPIGVDLHVPDLTGLAAAFGAASTTLASPDTLAAEIDRAWQRDRPTLIELPVPAVSQPLSAASTTAATLDGERS